MVSVFCLEGNWQPRDLTRSPSLEPGLELLQKHEAISYVHRTVATRTELEHYLRLLRRRPLKDFEFLYLAFHGNSRRALVFDDEPALSLQELGQLIRDSNVPKDFIIHLGSCYGLRVEQDELDAFRATTRAIAVSGYRKSVDTLQAAALELLLFNHLGGPWRDIVRRFQVVAREYPDLCEHLGFRFSPEA